MTSQPSDIPIKLSIQDADHLLAAVEWALGHDCNGGENESTLDEYIAPGLRRWPIEEAARKIESVAAMQRQGIVADDLSIIGRINAPHSSYTGKCPCGCGVEFVDGEQVLP